MSILKSILHRWNKENKSYDTLHPETESAQITDWHSGIMASLASTTLGTVVSAVTTDSVLGKLIKLLLDASGVKYLIDTNGYVCFGSLFGGLIIQWGVLTLNNRGDYGAYNYCNFPIIFSKDQYSIASIHRGTDAVAVYQLNTEINAHYCVLCAKKYDGSINVPWNVNWIAIGR